MTSTHCLILSIIFLMSYSYTMASNISLFNEDFDHFELDLSKSLAKDSRNSSLVPQSRGERGIYSEPHFEHEYHEPIHAPQYIVKLIAPRKHSKDTGVAELLLVLAPLAAIPLIGSAALTTFTALLATGGYGKRRKRDLTRDLLTHLTPKDQYMPPIANRDTDRSFDNFGKTINFNEKRHTFPTNHMTWRQTDSFGSQTNPKSQLIRVRVEDDLDGNVRTGVDAKHNRSENFADIAQQRVGTLVRVLEKPHKETISSSFRQSKGILGKPDQKEYEISLEKSPYRAKTDIIHDNQGVKDSIKKKKFDNPHKIDTHLKHISDSIRFEDLSSQASETVTRMIEPKSVDSPHVKQNDNEKSDRFDFNTWIPFLSNPYLVDIGKGEGKREIQELDIIQKYLNTKGRPDYNDEIIATYLSCNGMLSASNQCLERLTCQFSDNTSGLKQLEKDVSSLVIYSLLKNQHIDNGFKNRLQRAAFFGRDNPGKCNFYNCPKINDHKTGTSKRR